MAYIKPTEIIVNGRGLTSSASSATGISPVTLNVNTATTATLGIIQVGSGLSITPDGVLSATGGGTGNGYTGSAGSSGSVGFTGSAGSTGTQGTVGFTGSAGSTGGVGSTGTVGFTGSAGSTGTQGSAGFTGSVGFTGSRGDTGLGFVIAKSYSSVAALIADTSPTNIVAGQFAVIETGNVNDAENSRLYLWSGTAYSYVSDLSGAQGITGPQGNVGFTGSAGSTGGVGSTGTVGFTGSAGVGFTGSAGIGYTGSAGSTGTVGFTGSRGVDGVTTTTTVAAVTTIIGTTSTTAGIPGFADRSYTGSLNDAYTLSNGDLYIWKGGDLAGSTATSIEYLIVAGGGAGGGGGASTAGGSGGGAGGLLYNSQYSVNQGQTYNVTVGAGGTPGVGTGASSSGDGSNGSDSTFGNLTSIGGGGGRAAENNYPAGVAGKSGGSGGGASAYYTSVGGGGAGTIGQGSAGGTGASGWGGAGAGGGAGAVGGTGVGGTNGTISPSGGVGLQYSISGTATYYAGGGGSGNYSQTAGSGGLGGGGAGNTGAGNGVSGTPNTGGGGGGAGGQGTSYGGSGGSGIVIIRYADTSPAASATTGSPTITTAGGYRTYKWTTVGSGSITFASSAPTAGPGWVLVGNIKGTSGYTGSASTASGYAGSVGFTGSAGAGYTGSAGTNGYTGSAGSNGYTGSAGSTGTQGSAGFTGSAGSTGTQGSAGYTGSAGSTGTVGFTGSRGIDGVTTTTTVAAVTTIIGTTSTTAGIPGFADRSYTGALNDTYTLTNGDLYVWKGGDTAGGIAVDYLVVAGGGAGGGRHGGGGGAGGLVQGTTSSVAGGSSFTVTVGAGAPTATSGARGGSGSNSVLVNTSLGTITAIGGGGGGVYPVPNDPGVSGGSGGGGGSDGGTAAGGAGTAGQGFAGGIGIGNQPGDARIPGGGGGAGGAGTSGNYSLSQPGNGGVGVLWLDGYYYAGGGGGGNWSTTISAGNGGLGGGGGGGMQGSGTAGAGGGSALNSGTAGTRNTAGSGDSSGGAAGANTGGGGGGAGQSQYSSYTGTGGAGGSGIVIIRCADSTPAASSTTGSPTITVAGGYRFYKWTTIGSGSITFPTVAPVTGQGWVLVGNIKGTSGYTGSASTASGYAGSVGFTGSTGAGYTGSAGSNGYTGSAGSTGTQGSAGFTGSAGSTGTQGSAGYAGSTGYTGSQGESSFTWGSTPPGSPVVGDRWYDTNKSKLVVYVNDGDSTQWVEVAASGFLGRTGYTGSAGAGYTGSIGSTGTQGSIGFTGSGGVGSTGPKISSVVVTDSSYNTLDDTAIALTGGYIKILGSGFESGCQVLLGTTVATSVSYISSSEVRAQLPAASTGTYIIYLVNSDGGTAIRVNAVTFSPTPSWTTGASLAGAADIAISIQLAATDATSYALAAGSSLPSGVTLSSGGLLSGTITGLSVDTTYNFTIIATDAELQDSTRAFTFAITVGEPYFKYVSLLLPGNGTNNANNNTFIDSSTNNFTITRNGNPTQGTFSPYGTNWSNYFDGTGDYLTLPSNAAFGFGTGDFTMECWIFPTSTKAAMRLWEFGGDADNIDISITSTGTINYYNGSTSILSSAGVISFNSWSHIALVRSSGTVKVYVNGTSQITQATTPNTGARAFYIGGVSNGWYEGYISNMRIVKGTAVYTSAFTPSTTPLTAITNTQLLTCQSNRLIDSSTNAFAITKNGDVSIQRFSPFSPPVPYSTSTISGSAYFDGNGDYLSVPSSTAFAFPSGVDFTAEGWVYLTSYSPGTITGGALIGTVSGATSGWYINLGQDINTLRITSNASGTWADNISVTTGNGVPLNVWTHIAFVRNGGSLVLYKNGVSVASMSGASTYNFTSPNNSVYVGYNSDGPNPRYVTGYISNVRVVKGTAVYTSSFTPPTAPLTAISGTSLLTNFTNAGIIDNAMQNNIETVGDVKISTTQYKFGSGSLYFDGTGDYCFLQNTQAFLFGSGDFTIELWAYISDTSTRKYILGPGTDTDTHYDGFGLEIWNQQLSMWASSNGTGWNMLESDTGSNRGSTLLAANTWYHIAVTRSGNTFRSFVNGVVEKTFTVSGTIFSNASIPYNIGRTSYLGGNFYYNGYMDDLRVTRGYARYIVYSATTSNTTASSIRSGSSLAGFFGSYGVFNTTAAGQYLLVDFGVSVSNIQTTYLNYNGGQWAPTSVLIQTSNDNSTWSTVVTYSDNNTNTLQTIASTGSGRYWRIYQNSATRQNSAGYEWHLGNFTMTSTFTPPTSALPLK